MSARPDPEMFLRAALHAAADSLEPRSNGLVRIQARLRRPRPVAVQWAVDARNQIFMQAPAAVQDACYRLAYGIRVVWEQFEQTANRRRHGPGTQGWLRPAALMAAVVFIVAAGTYTAISAASLISPSTSGSHSGNYPGPPGDQDSVPGTSATHSYTPHSPKPSTTASCKPAAPATSAPPSSSPSASPSPTPTGTPASTDSPGPSPSDSQPSSPAPSDSVPASPTPSTGATTQPPPPAASATPCAAAS